MFWIVFAPLSSSGAPALTTARPGIPPMPAGLADTARELPAPSLTEPFAIGEALYDPARVDVAVVSLLELMGVGVNKPDGTPLRPVAKRGGAPFRLSEPEVQLLIEMGRADATAAAKKGRPPFSFRDLHRAVAPLLPAITIEKLAGSYAEAYQTYPEALAPQVLMGQPIEPKTPLTRVQLWLLLVDGFVPPATPKLAQLAPFRLAQPEVSLAFGIASTMLPPLPSPDPRWSGQDWFEMVARLPVIGFSVPFSISPTTASAHEGHGGPGQAVRLEARLGAPATPIISSMTGHLLLAPRMHDLSGRPINWRVPDAAVLQAHGSLSPAPGTTVPTDLTGTASIQFLPKAEKANGRGRELNDAVGVVAAISLWDLLSSHYDLPPAVRGFVFGEHIALGGISVAWHVEKWIEISIANEYDIKLNLGPLGKGTRRGLDGAAGLLTLQADGTYLGTIEGFASANQELHGLGQSCAPAKSEGWQKLRVVGRKVPGFSTASGAAPGPAIAGNPLSGILPGSPSYQYLNGQPNGGYLALEFFPVSNGRYSQRDKCQTEIQQTDDPSLPWFLPYNDARWTIAGAGYVIALPASGTLHYKEKYLSSPTFGRSEWDVEVERGN
jgi:hypothetical protein